MLDFFGFHDLLYWLVSAYQQCVERCAMNLKPHRMKKLLMGVAAGSLALAGTVPVAVQPAVALSSGLGQYQATSVNSGVSFCIIPIFKNMKSCRQQRR